MHGCPPRVPLALAVVLILTACASQAPMPAPATTPAPTPTPTQAPSPAATELTVVPHRGYEEASFLFGLTDDATFEVSGVVASSLQDGVLFVHNDSPTARHLDPPYDNLPWPFAADLFAIAPDGSLLATYHLAGALNRDWEDIARGPGLDGVTPSLWIADIGDNDRSWTEGLTLYVLPEPTVDLATPGALLDVPAAGFDQVLVRYPDGPHDAEAFLVHPVTGEAVIITKEAGPEQVYRLVQPVAPWPEQNELVHIGAFRLDAPVGTSEPRSYEVVTGADWAPDGSRLAITTYREVHEFEAQGTDVLTTIEGGLVTRLLLPPREELRQVEAVGYSRDGRDVYVLSEEGDNLRARRPAYVLRERVSQ